MELKMQDISTVERAIETTKRLRYEPEICSLTHDETGVTCKAYAPVGSVRYSMTVTDGVHTLTSENEDGFLKLEGQGDYTVTCTATNVEKPEYSSTATLTYTGTADLPYAFCPHQPDKNIYVQLKVKEFYTAYHHFEIDCPYTKGDFTAMLLMTDGENFADITDGFETLVPDTVCWVEGYSERLPGNIWHYEFRFYFEDAQFFEPKTYDYYLKFTAGGKTYTTHKLTIEVVE